MKHYCLAMKNLNKEKLSQKLFLIGCKYVEMAVFKFCLKNEIIPDIKINVKTKLTLNLKKVTVKLRDLSHFPCMLDPDLEGPVKSALGVWGQGAILQISAQ